MFLWEYALSSPHPQVVAWPTGKRYFPRAWREREKQRSLREAATGILWKRKLVFQGKLSIVLLSLQWLISRYRSSSFAHAPGAFSRESFLLVPLQPPGCFPSLWIGRPVQLWFTARWNFNIFRGQRKKTGAHIKRLYHRVLDFVPDWTVEMSEVFLLSRNVQANWCTQEFSKQLKLRNMCFDLLLTQMSS